MRVNCQLEREKEDTEGQGGQGRKEDSEYYFFQLTGNGEYWDILRIIIQKNQAEPPLFQSGEGQRLTVEKKSISKSDWDKLGSFVLNFKSKIKLTLSSFQLHQVNLMQVCKSQRGVFITTLKSQEWTAPGIATPLGLSCPRQVQFAATTYSIVAQHSSYQRGSGQHTVQPAF